MGDVAALLRFVETQLDADELLAKEAGRVRGEAMGAHWQWVNPDNDVPFTVDMGQEFLGHDDGSDWCRASLRSLEQQPSRSVGPLPEFIVPGEDEMKTVHAAHIATWDPARVLAEIAAKRAILAKREVIESVLEEAIVKGYIGVPEVEADRLAVMDEVVRILAQPYAGWPGWQAEWAVQA